MLGCAITERKRLWTVAGSESGMTEMSTFVLQLFTDNPTLDKFDKCRKDDLKITNHYRISVVRQALNKKNIYFSEAG